MNERTIMKNFLQYMRKEHRYNIKWPIFWVCSILIFLLNNRQPTYVNDKEAADLHIAVSGILLAIASVLFFRKYTELVPTTREKIKKNGQRPADILIHTNLSEIVRTHAFDVKTYFCLLIERFMIVQGVSIALIMLMAAFKVIVMSSALVYSGMILIIPLVIWNWETVLMDAARTHKKGAAYTAFMSIYYFIESIIAVCVLAYVFVTVVLLISGFVQSKMLLGDIDAQVIAKVGTDDWITVLLIILALVLAVFFADVNQLIIHIRWTKIMKSVVTGIVLTIVILFVLQGIGCKKDHVVLWENSISVKQVGFEKTYSFDEIKAYSVYYKDTDIKMKVTFSDGRSEDIFYSSSTYTDGWEERYYSDYQYAAELVDMLLQKGVPGTVEESAVKALEYKHTEKDTAYLRHMIDVLEKNKKNS